VVLTADQLHEIARRILLAAGADDRNASRVADALVSANLSGVDTHGVLHLPTYVADIRSGHIVPTAWPSVVHETALTALVTGNWTFGHVAAKQAIELAVEKARSHGVAAVGVVQAHHIGRLGEYVEIAASHGMIAQVWAGGYAEEAPTAVPFGGRRPVLHTNPIAVGFPSGEEAPVILDFATTAVSGARVLLARENRQRLPPGAIVDRDGNPTTDPEDFFAGGAHQPFGGHKGYGLMVAAELLGRVLTGADAFAEPTRGGPIMGHQGVTMIVLRADLFQPMADFRRRADELESRLRAVPPAPGFGEVLVPGDPESRARTTRQREGIPVSGDVWRSLTGLAESLGLERIASA
jgi:LDH2 family malate/lactate/ureidoglycolate dehydrogenase